MCDCPEPSDTPPRESFRGRDSKESPPGKRGGHPEPHSSGGSQALSLGLPLPSACWLSWSAAGGVGSFSTEEVQRLSVSVKSCVRGWGGDV